MIKFIDFLFWSYYCFANRHKKIYWGDNVWQAIGMIYGTIILPMASVYSLVSIFVISLPTFPEPGTIEGVLLMAIISSPIFLLLDYRYYHNPKIVKNKFELFRKQWGEDPRCDKKGRIIVIVYTLLSIVGCLCLAIVIGELNRRGLLDGYRLIQ